MKQQRILAACLLAAIMMTGCKGKAEEPVQTPMEDGQAIVTEEPEEIKESEALLQDIAAQQQGEYQGVDVSRFQGTIDWNRVKEAGMEFAMIRVGYRKESTGVIEEDSNARYNLQEATAAGIPCGVYFFSTATNEEEAREEPQIIPLSAEADKLLEEFANELEPKLREEQTKLVSAREGGKEI